MSAQFGTSHIGPAAQLLHNAHACISCSYNAWLSFMEDAQGSIFDILREFDERSQNMQQFYGIVNKNTAFKSYRSQINKFYSTTSNYISQLKANLINLNQTLNPIDKQVQSTIDRLTNTTYLTCIDAIQDSLTQNKNCAPDILLAQNAIFATTSDGIRKCFRKFIEFHPFNGLTSLGLRIPTKTFIQFIACTTGKLTKSQIQTCLKSVKNLKILPSMPKFSFHHRSSIS